MRQWLEDGRAAALVAGFCACGLIVAIFNGSVFWTAFQFFAVYWNVKSSDRITASFRRAQ